MYLALEDCFQRKSSAILRDKLAITTRSGVHMLRCRKGRFMVNWPIVAAAGVGHITAQDAR